MQKRQLTGQLGEPEDVAAAALYLASDESRFVLGSGLVRGMGACAAPSDAGAKLVDPGA